MKQTNKDILLKDITPQELLQIGAEAFTQEIKKMIEKKIIAPYDVVVKRDQEIEKLKKKITELEAKNKKE